jgi:hypothetical protein
VKRRELIALLASSGIDDFVMAITAGEAIARHNVSSRAIHKDESKALRPGHILKRKGPY